MRRRTLRRQSKLPDTRVYQTIEQYIAAFTKANNLKPSEFTIGGKVVTA